MKHSQPTIHVIGAGVTGLTTALLLRMNGYDVTILAKDFPDDQNDAEFNSRCAGTAWKPTATHSETRLQRYEATSFKMLWEMARNHPSEAGIMVVPAYDYYENAEKDQDHPWWKYTVPGFESVCKKELPPNMNAGYHFTTVVINSQRYLQWLQSQYLTLGGKRKRMTLSHILDAAVDNENVVDVIVNCTGVQARWLGGVQDSRVVPVRVQDVIVRASHIRKTVFVQTENGCSYVVPRSDGTVVLGTAEKENETDSTIHLDTAKDIMERVALFCPELTQGKRTAELDVVGHAVGINGRRRGGPRVDNEFIRTSSGKRVLITHNYGHAGNGYQSSWGSAKHAVRLVEEGFGVLKLEASKVRALLSRL
ncbi:hypothetical protein EC973_007010 [Apophysomyces ossiformis]|uniref:FAD dependent oxidoreductase domain-containing protein n=1 Tax=Apophysomyces ossiformis TaxID=679940 RepID=A0A8H7BUC5_9FUNG|nr:hypothetical protein EC973_007010 [Apophysomyces ossiformis]